MNGMFSTALRRAVLMLAVASVATIAQAMEVRVVRATPWSAGDTVREGAEEFLILMEVARLGRDAGGGALVGIGDRRGLFAPGAERALERAVRHGVPVVKLAAQGRVLPAPHGLFVDGTGFSEGESSELLERCVKRHGPIPAVGENPSASALAGLRQHLTLYQREFSLAAATRVAAR